MVLTEAEFAEQLQHLEAYRYELGVSGGIECQESGDKCYQVCRTAYAEALAEIVRLTGQLPRSACSACHQDRTGTVRWFDLHLCPTCCRKMKEALVELMRKA